MLFDGVYVHKSIGMGRSGGSFFLLFLILF